MACFGWIGTIGPWLTLDNLQKRGFAFKQIDSYLREEDQETVNLLFLRCKVSRQCWDLFLNF